MTAGMGLTTTINGKKYDLVYKDSNKVRVEKVVSQFAGKGYDVKLLDPNGRGFWYVYTRENKLPTKPKDIGEFGKPKLAKFYGGKKLYSHVKNKAKQIKQNLSTVHDFMWGSLKHEPVDLGTFGGKGMAARNPNIRNIELRRFDDIDKEGRFWKCMGVAFLKETAENEFKQFKKMKNHDVKLIKKGDLYLIVAAEKGIVWGRKK
jgi:hypothetical protein